MFDTLAVLAASATVTGTTSSAAFNLPAGTPVTGLVARVLYSAASQASGSGVVTFEIQHCATSGGTYRQLAVAAIDRIVLTTSDQAGEIFIPFRTNQPYIKLVATFSGSPTTPTITYEGWLGLAKP